jgi:hypothetical protein
MIAMTIATIGRFMKKLAKLNLAPGSMTGLIMKKMAVWQPQRLEEPQ